ncbi:putative metal-binding motif-containing protein [Candidatus Woesearchaeota archaeon]|nr:putative metal-binding motif-containing protein [Candidatus Woesearchaeota archaeon]
MKKVWVSSLAIFFLIVAPLSYADNTNCAEALPKAMGVKFPTKLTASGQSRWFKLDPTDDGQLYTDFSSTVSGNPNYDLGLYDECGGTLIDSSTLPGMSDDAMWTRVTDEDYFLRVYGSAGTYNHNLILETQFKDCDKDEDAYDNYDYPACKDVTEEDCDDNDANTNPGASEKCDGKDNDCNGSVDEGLTDCCGDGRCDSGETGSGCPSDCYEAWSLSWVNPPSEANEGDVVPLQVNIRNTGTIDGTTKIQAAIYPDDWAGTYFPSMQTMAIRPFSIVLPINNCCVGETFVETKHVTLAQGEETTLTFGNIIAQESGTTSPCVGDATDSSYTLFSGTFEECNGGYNRYILQDFAINACQDSPGCDACLDRDDGTTSSEKCDCAAECSSGNCGGGSDPYYNFHCTDADDGSDTYWYYYEDRRNSCGGGGYIYDNSLGEGICTDEEVGCTDCICDEDHDDAEVDGYSDPCRKKIGAGCAATSDCWNDRDGDGDNWCNSLDKCTDGANGRNCGEDNDCSSGRCDSTCKARLANWKSCDEDSDCISDDCTGSLCLPPSPVCGDIHCEDSRGENGQNCPDDCNCDSNADCPDGYFCDFKAGDDLCKEITYPDECTTEGAWFCQDGDVYLCEQRQQQKKSTLKKSCRLDKVCDPNTVGSTHDCGSSEIDLQIEDAAPGVQIFKQPGDFVTVYIFSKTDQDISFDFNSGLKLEEGVCQKGAISLTEKITKCVFSVEENAGGVLRFKAANKEKGITVINNPALLIITNKQKLNERFASNPSGVQALLAKAYEKAAKGTGIVYDINMEFEGHPFRNYLNYYQDPLDPSMVDNTYSLGISRLISEKCNGCGNTIILGDDYIIPWHRADVKAKEGWLSTAFKNVFTDTPFIETSDAEFLEFEDLFKFRGKFSGKTVRFLFDENAPQDFIENITLLQSTMRKEFKSTVKNHSLDAFLTSCNSKNYFSIFDGSTLVVIGTPGNNYFFNCFPYATGEDRDDTVALERSPWDKNSYALLINTENPFVLETFNTFIVNKTYEKIPSKNIWFVEIGLDAFSYLSILGEFLTGIPLDTLGDVADSVNDCWFKKDIIFCKVSVAMIGVQYVPAKAVKTLLNRFRDIGGKAVEVYLNYPGEMGNFFLKLLKENKAQRFLDAFRKAGDFGEDIFKIFRGKVSRFDNAISKASNNVDFFDNKLSREAQQVSSYSIHGPGGKYLPEPLAQGAAFGNLEKRGMELANTESDLREIKKTGAIGADFVGRFAGEKVGVSVTRAVRDSTGTLESSMESTLRELVENKDLYPPTHKWDKGLVYVIAETEKLGNDARAIAEFLIKKNAGVKGWNEIHVVFTVIPDQNFIFRGIAS